MGDEIKLKFSRDKPLHEDIEEHYKKIEKIAEDAKELLESRVEEARKEPVLKLSVVQTSGQKEYSVKRIRTGIEGFDELIEGGLPERSLVLLTGSTGSGKSIFAMNFLVEGAMNGENGVYISLQESMDETINEMRFFGWPIDSLIEEGKILIIQPELYNYDALLTAIEEAIDKVHARRLVIDSISIIGMYFEEPFKIRKSLLDLGRLLKKLDCTTLAITEIGEGKSDLSNFGVEEFTADGVIVLYYVKKGNIFLRAVAVRKLRSTKHSTKIHPIEIRRPGGILVYPSEEVFSDV